MLSVIIPARNAAATLPACLAALNAQTLPRNQYEVIVADDGSTDDTAPRAEAAGVTVLRLLPRGPAAARNAGARAARGDLLAFTDADCQPAPDWLAALVTACADPDVAGAKGAYRTRERNLVARFVQQEYEDKYDRLARHAWIDFVDTYACAYRRDVFLANGGFEESFPAPSVEDQEFSFRLAGKGYHLRFAPQAVVYHRHDLSLREYLARKFGIGCWKAFLLRWHPERAAGDSHTPLALRAQIGLLGLGGAAVVGALAWPALWALVAALAAAFALSTVPFLLKVARRDALVLLVAPLLLTARALALGLGLFAGFLTPRPTPRRAPVSFIAAALKRALDILLSLIGLLLAAPLILLAALVVILDSPGSAFFVQERVGEHGRLFRMLKLRTMVAGADALAEQVAARSPLAGPAFKLPNDPRVTRVGRFLRRWSLDELPQLWNVLVGDMSLVGPRPEEPRVVAQYSDWHRQRLAVRPGLTGPMQINGRGDLPLDDRVRLELDYIEHYSLWRDLKILARTLPTVLSGRGAY